jgi:hypothetical protein
MKMSMTYIRKEVASENADGTLMVKDAIMKLVPCTVYDKQHVIELIAPAENEHIAGYKNVMKNFDIEIVS